MSRCPCSLYVFFFFNDPATTEIYTLSLHDALPIFTPRKMKRRKAHRLLDLRVPTKDVPYAEIQQAMGDRKSTRLNSSHTVISYAVFCLKKKTPKATTTHNEYIRNEQRHTLCAALNV